MDSKEKIRTKDGRNYVTYKDARAFNVEWFFYTDDGVNPRIVSPQYCAPELLGINEAMDNSWESFCNGTTSEHQILSAVDPLRASHDDEIDHDRNKQLEELEKLPKTLFFNYTPTPLTGYNCNKGNE